MALRLISGDAGMGTMFLLFFAVNPIASLGLGILTGSEFKRYWFIPLTVAVLFPFLFSLILLEMVWDLFVYSPTYLVIGYLGAVITHFVKRKMKK